MFIMRKFLINVNGHSYEVEVEEIRDGATVAAPATVSSPAAAPAPAPAATSAPSKKETPAAAPKAAAPASIPEGAETIKAPMPGTILSVNVKVGDTVKAGDVVCILEAMKMENEIMAPKEGKVVAVNVSQGSSVNSGDVLVVIG